MRQQPRLPQHAAASPQQANAAGLPPLQPSTDLRSRVVLLPLAPVAPLSHCGGGSSAAPAAAALPQPPLQRSSEFVSLPHPRHGSHAWFMLRGDQQPAAAAAAGEQQRHAALGFHKDAAASLEVLEVQVISRGPASYFANQSVVRDGSLYVCSPFDPLYLALAILHQQPVDRRGFFRPVDEALEVAQFPAIEKLIPTLTYKLDAICQVRKSEYDGVLVRYDHAMALNFLKFKLRKVYLALGDVVAFRERVRRRCAPGGALARVDSLGPLSFGQSAAGLSPAGPASAAAAAPAAAASAAVGPSAAALTPEQLHSNRVRMIEALRLVGEYLPAGLLEELCAVVGYAVRDVLGSRKAGAASHEGQSGAAGSGSGRGSESVGSSVNVGDLTSGAGAVGADGSRKRKEPPKAKLSNAQQKLRKVDTKGMASLKSMFSAARAKGKKKK